MCSRQMMEWNFLLVAPSLRRESYSRKLKSSRCSSGGRLCSDNGGRLTAPQDVFLSSGMQMVGRAVFILVIGIFFVLVPDALFTASQRH